MMVISSTDKDNSVLFLAKRSPPVGIYFQLADRRELFERIISAGEKSPQFAMKHMDSDCRRCLIPLRSDDVISKKTTFHHPYSVFGEQKNRARPYERGDSLSTIHS